jgi:anti-anti-sigma regulatory factor
MINFDYKPLERKLTCSFTGRLDTIACQTLSGMIGEKLGAMTISDDKNKPITDHVEFDLQASNFISSSFIRICLQTSRQVGKGNFSIINCDPFIKKTFKIAGLDELLKVT